MEDKQYTELTEFIGEQFNKVFGEFGVVHKRIDGMEGSINALDQKFTFKFDDLKKDFRELQTAVDAYAVKADTYFQEMVMLAHKVDRLEKWINQIAEKVGIKLS